MMRLEELILAVEPVSGHKLEELCESDDDSSEANSGKNRWHRLYRKFAFVCENSVLNVSQYLITIFSSFSLLLDIIIRNVSFVSNAIPIYFNCNEFSGVQRDCET